MIHKVAYSEIKCATDIFLDLIKRVMRCEMCPSRGGEAEAGQPLTRHWLLWLLQGTVPETQKNPNIWSSQVTANRVVGPGAVQAGKPLGAYRCGQSHPGLQEGVTEIFLTDPALPAFCHPHSGGSDIFCAYTSKQDAQVRIPEFSAPDWHGQPTSWQYQLLSVTHNFSRSNPEEANVDLSTACLCWERTLCLPKLTFCHICKQ